MPWSEWSKWTAYVTAKGLSLCATVLMYEPTPIMLSAVLFPGGSTGTVRSGGCLLQGLDMETWWTFRVAVPRPGQLPAYTHTPPSHPNQTKVRCARGWLPNAIRIGSTLLVLTKYRFKLPVLEPDWSLPCISLVPTKNCLAYCLKQDHDHYLPHPNSLFTHCPIIRTCVCMYIQSNRWQSATLA
jgi:hypothetical protein